MGIVLQSIELQGFKSFASKTLITLTDNVTGIVGPNGSGKSNVIDALRWCLGEREAKQLRGETLDNLIFAGTPKKPAVSVAKVSLTFSNRDRIFAIDAEEIVLERRIDRSGESEFYLNREIIKLKELVPVLARAKLGTRGLTMIGQGQSDLFIRSSPSERRMMVEEVLGLREFRIKKTQAVRRLASSEANMEKIKAMLDELEPHLKFLKRQKARYDRRAEIELELRRIEDEYYSIEIKKTSSLSEAQTLPLSKLEKERVELLNKITAKEAEIAAYDNKAREDEEIHKIRRDRMILENSRRDEERELARVEAKIEVQSVPVSKENSKDELVRALLVLKDEMSAVLEKTSEDVKTYLKQWVVRIENFFAKKSPIIDSELVSKREEKKKSIGEIDLEIKDLREKEDLCLKMYENDRKAYRSVVEERETVKNKLRDVERELSEVRFSLERGRLRLAELKSQWTQNGRSEEDFEKLGSLDFSSIDVDPGAMTRMTRLRGELAVIGEIDEGTLTEVREAEGRYSLLSREHEDLLNAKKDLTKLIDELDLRIHADFKKAFLQINNEFTKYFSLMFGGGKAQMKLKQRVQTQTENQDAEAGVDNLSNDSQDAEEENAGVEIELSLPKKRITSLEMLSGGEKSLVSLSALFALIAVSPPPFLVLDEIDAPLDETNARRFSALVSEFAKKTQFIVITHNRITMEAADVLYGVTMGDDGASKIYSMKLSA